ncbi:hypothetical protein BaOVIS_019020 [Babesia ovis]|uniref:Uncharacterized protein n=1 Tax=Babesia ovis TaxID=5869 RepID=A0A9W5TD38_BABOV|nr:hypothetical protein BaOVIS_019020 [Babesia ovis]
MYPRVARVHSGGIVLFSSSVLFKTTGLSENCCFIITAYTSSESTTKSRIFVAATGEYTALTRITKEKAQALIAPPIAQATAADPNRHNMHRALVTLRNTSSNVKHPIVQFNIVGDMSEIGEKRLDDLSFVFTTVETCKFGRPNCTEPFITVNLFSYDVDRNGNISNKRVIDSVTTPDINMIGHRFRIKFPGAIKNKVVDYKQFAISLGGKWNCSYKFVVDLEEPNNYFDAVAKAR